MATIDKDFKVKNGIQVSEGGTFGGPVSVGTPTDSSHAITLEYLNGLSFTGAMEVSETPPSSPASGDMWFDSTSGATFVYYDSYWIQVMSATGPQGPQGEPGNDGVDGQDGATGPAGTTSYTNLTDKPDLSVYQQKISGVSDTEIGYLDGVTSAIQTQLNGKQPVVADVSSTEIGYLANVTSDIQTQLNSKPDLLSPTITMASFASASNSVDPVTISSANGHGGTGFAGIMTVENTTSGATNTKKFLRMTSGGAIEFVNNAYSQTIFSLSDEGNLGISGVMNGATLGDTGWQSVSSFSNGYSAPTAVAYRRINNVVYMRGNVYNGTANTTAFTLPTGYRPSVDVVVPVQQYGTGNINYVTVSTSGTVTPNGTAAWLSSVVFPIG